MTDLRRALALVIAHDRQRGVSGAPTTRNRLDQKRGRMGLARLTYSRGTT